MSSGQLSSFRSSSDCSTARVSPSSSRSDDAGGNNSTAFSETIAQSNAPWPLSAASAMTPPASEAFVSPRSERTDTGEMSSFIYTASPPKRGRARDRKRVASLSNTVPAVLPTPSSVNSARFPGPTPSSLQASREQEGRPLNGLRSTSQASAAGAAERSLFGSAAESPSVQSLRLPESLGSALRSPLKLSARRSVTSSPLVPSSRGSENDRRRRADTVGGTSGSSLLPPLAPSVRRPPMFSASGSNSANFHGNQRMSFPSVEAKASPLDGSTGSDADTAVQPLATVTTAQDGENDWWEAMCQLVSNHTEKVSAYLENLVDPGGVAAAAATEARAADASRSRANSRVPRISTRRTFSRSDSMSSDSGAAYNPNGRSSPARAPLSSAGNRDRRAFFEPFNKSVGLGADERQNSEGSFAVPLDLVVIDPSQGTFLRNNPTTVQPVLNIANRDAGSDTFMGTGDETGLDIDCYDGEPNTYVVDLVSALRGYQSSQTEPFGHLVAAALASRSKKSPVHGFEIAAADHNPYLVRLILDSGKLDESDVEAQRHVQETMTELLSINGGELSPAIYEYLTSFFSVPFTRLSHREYTMLKRSGFEYIKLMYDHQHVLPDEPLHSILINQSHKMHILNLVFMVMQLCAIVFTTVAIALVLGKWMVVNDGALQNYGFYTLIVYGGGWALNLICIICTVRNRQDEAQYEPRYENGEYVMVLSPYTAVVPVLPLFDIFCLIAYVRALKQKRMILGHNIVACSRLSSIFYAILFAFPQLITQGYFNNIETSIDPQSRHRWPYIVLLVAATTQWCVALFGYAWLLFTHDSINGFGFACFNLDKAPHILERHTAVAHVLHFAMASVLETNVYLLATTAIALPVAICSSYHITILIFSSFTIVYILTVYTAILLMEGSTVRISFSSVPLLVIQLALLISSERIGVDECASFRYLYFRRTFVFGYLSWGAYFTLFVVWLILMMKWCVLCRKGVNIFPRLLWPLARKDAQFASQTKEGGDVSASPTDSSSGGAA